MTRAIVTGMNGTVAPVLAEYLREQDIEVIAWERDIVPVDDRETMDEFLEQEGPDWFFHLAAGPAEWAGQVARYCATHAIRFLYASCVSVFDSSKRGPIPAGRVPDATDEYGLYKIACEEEVLAANRMAIIARLGWQLQNQRGGNTLTEHLWKQQEDQGVVDANSSWKPACAYVEDTVEALFYLMRNNLSDTFHLDGNSRSLSMLEIATELNRHQKGAWNIQEVKDPVINTRMPDPRVRISSIRERLMRPSGPVFIDG